MRGGTADSNIDCLFGPISDHIAAEAKTPTQFVPAHMLPVRHKTLITSSLFSDVTQSWLVVTEVSEKKLSRNVCNQGPITLRNIDKERRKPKITNKKNPRCYNPCPGLGWLIGFSQRSQGFIPRAVYVRTVTVYLRVHRFISDSAVPPTFLATDSVVNNDTLFPLQVCFATELLGNRQKDKRLFVNMESAVLFITAQDCLSLGCFRCTWGVQVLRYPNFFLGTGSR